MKTVILSIFLLSFLYVLTGCKDDAVPPKGDEDPGILQTDEFGNMLGGDMTDWCWRGASNGFSFGAAYPNPTDFLFTIRFRIGSNDTVKMYFLRSASDTITVVHDTLSGPGTYSYSINVSTYNFANSYRRLYIKCHTLIASDSCRNYGDIKFVQ